MIKVLELFSGIGACSKALERLGIEHKIVDSVEIDKYAVKSFNAIHGTNFEPQDITKWDKDIECDLIMHGSPCQDFSVAGLGKGGDKDSGTRSSLMYETLRIVEKLKPKYVIWENVKNLLSKKHQHNYFAYIKAMNALGYKSYGRVLNAKDYGVPQNRERVFTISILGDGDFEFPEPMPLDKRLKDVLEESVDEKYYLSEEAIEKMRNSNFNQAKARENKTDICGTLCARDYKDPQCVRIGGLYDKEGETHQAGSIYDKNGISPTLSTMRGGNLQPMTVEPKIIDDMYKNREAREYSESCPTIRSERSGLKVAEPFCVASRGRGENNEQHLEPRKDGNTNTITSVQKDNYVVIGSSQKHAAKNYDGVCPTLTSAMGCGGGQVPMHNVDYRIRKLTPKECWRLMGFDDSDFEKAEKVNSNTQLYKQAGNSIVVNVLEGILKNLLETK